MCVGGGLEQNSAGLRPSRNWVWHPWCKTTGDNVKRKNYWQKTCFPQKTKQKKQWYWDGAVLLWAVPEECPLVLVEMVTSPASRPGSSRCSLYLRQCSPVGLSLLLYSWRSASTSWWPKCVASSIGVLPHLEDINVYFIFMVSTSFLVVLLLYKY